MNKYVTVSHGFFHPIDHFRYWYRTYQQFHPPRTAFSLAIPLTWMMICAALLGLILGVGSLYVWPR